MACGPLTGHSTHIVGGDLSYRCLGNQQYEITLTLRRDCLNGNPSAQFDNPAFVGIFNHQGVLMQQLGRMGVLNMAFRHDDTLNEILIKSCGIVGGDVCVHTTSYVDTLVLPMQAGGYLLAYQRCCRNYTIRNIVDPLESGATYTVEITEDALRSCNNSPVLASYPPVYICGGQPISFDQKAYDAEGDSLVYKLCVPYLGANQLNPQPAVPSSPPYVEVGFSGNYRLDNMIGGLPPLSMSASSGIMTGFAEPIVAQYLIAYCIEEYRNGQLLSVLRRDFQINVRLCNSVPVARFAIQTNECSGQFTIQCLDASEDAFASIVDWKWTVEHNNQRQTSNMQNPLFSFIDTGNLQVTLVVTSSESCKDTMSQNLRLQAPLPRESYRRDTLCKFDSITLGVAFDSSARYLWNPADGLQCTTCAQTKASPTQNTRYIVRTIKLGCEIFDTIDVVVKECILDPCYIQMEFDCLPSGMVQIRAVDALGKLIQPVSRQFELFWSVGANVLHSAYAMVQQNPVLVFPGDVVSLTGKYYHWPTGKPHRLEFAEICERRVSDTIDVICTGPCEEFVFTLSSCEDDYDQDLNLNYPPSICETICGGSCQYTIALFEQNGQLIDPSAYQIRWSDGSDQAYVRKMGPYYNNLWAEVRRGDCVWRGKYIKSCRQFGNHLGSLRQLYTRSSNNFEHARTNCNVFNSSFRLYSITGVYLTNELKDLQHLPKGIYLMVDFTGTEPVNYKWVID